MTKPSQNGQLNAADTQLWTVMDYRPPKGETKQLKAVQEALAAGANPDLASREFNDFRSVLGLAVLQRRASVVGALLAGGAKPHWPSDETDIDAEELAGEPDTSYGGHPVDPLSVAFDQLGWALAEMQATPQSRDQILPLRECIAVLLEHGAPWRVDPATAHFPIDRMMLTLVENCASPSQATLQATSECLFDALVQLDPGNVQKMLDGQWRSMGACAWEWDEDLPELPTYLRQMAEQVALQQHTPAAFAQRQMRL